MAAAGFGDVCTTTRALAKQASIDRSRAAIQGLNDAAELLRSQSDLLACLDDSGDEAVPTPEMQKIAVQRFLSRRLSRQASLASSNCLAAPGAETLAVGVDKGATIVPTDGYNTAAESPTDGGQEQTAVEDATRANGEVAEQERLPGCCQERQCRSTSKEDEHGEPVLPTVPALS